MFDKKITIIIPVYNEAGIIEHVVRDFYEKAVRKMPHAQFIIAEDGSTDGTKEILKRLNKEIPFMLVSSDIRKGYSKAFYDALKLVRTELIFFSDSDGQHKPGDVYKLLEKIGEYDIVGGYKHPCCDPAHRIILSKGYNFLIRILFGLKMRDIDSGFKVIKKTVIDDVLKDPLRFDCCVMSEFVLKAYLSGYKIAEVPISHYPRKAGSSTIFTPGRLPGIIAGVLRGLMELKFKQIRMRMRS